MLLTVNEDQRSEYSDIFRQMYELRARQFKDRRGWRVDVTNGMERDRFDELNPLYICVVSPDRKKLMASLRLLPTTGPHMLSDVFPEVMGGAPIIRDPLILESSRFCVDTQMAKGFGPEGINYVTRQLLLGLFATAHDRGIKQIISVFDVYMERILARSGCIFDRVGPVQRYDNLRTVGGLFQVGPEVIGALRRPERRTAA